MITEAPTLVTDQYHAGTAARARRVADAMTDDGWLDVTTSGALVMFPTIAGNPDARYRVSEVARGFDIYGRAAETSVAW